MSRTLEQVSRGRAIEARRGQAVLAMLQVAALGALLGFVIGAATVWMMTSIDDRHLAVLWLRQQLNPALIFQVQQTGFGGPVPSPERVAAIRLLTRMAVAGVVVAAPLAIGLTMLLRRQWIMTAQAAALDQVLRGNRVATAQELTALVMKAKPQGPLLRIGTVPIPPQDEARHMLLAGRSGSGKTTLLHALVAQTAERGEHAILFDADGSYVERFYNAARGDIILNVMDARTARWNPLADVADLADAYRLAAVLLSKPANISEATIWYDQGRAVLAQIIHHLARTGQTSLDDLATMITSASADTLRGIVAGTPAARAFEPGAERATASVLFMLNGAARIVTALAAVPPDASPFSFDAFYATLDQHTGPKPLIFLSSTRRSREATAPIIAACIDAAASAILQRSIDGAPKVWMFLDELASLPPVQSLMVLLPEGRKYQVGVVLAFQSIAQLHQTYTEAGSQVITGQTATQVLMATGDHMTAKWGVDLFGTIEVENQRPNESLGTDPKAERGSLATTRERKTLVIDADLTGLKTGEALLRLSGLPIAQLTIDPPQAMPVIAPAFIPAAVPMPVVAAIVGDTPPTPAPASRIEDRDDWLTAGPL
ncbi:type IV secretion system DNA-binding domain-containing protein [Sphingomonas bacterium]|uniref:type IV secretion system DNA-binding domain-containing protein n=1 Tax=Sphingomonas bacterium TaxID=1895847 RepID=UPI001576BEC9|nr:type IV secretion system DNA-binding domain-containing protein [Sphingomonas bacterium]